MTHLTLRSRILVAIAALLLLGMFVTPLWRIELLAPQYPEGLGMLIRLTTITGIKPADLDNINGLNHYIGMQRIVPDAIPVLHVMPWVLGTLVVFSVLAAVTGLRALLGGWLVSFALAGAAGMTEFYLWSYDYGHNLAPDAIIKVPGMTYQPPLIGTKQLLNFTAASWPASGSWLAAAAFALGVVAFFSKHPPITPKALSRAGGRWSATPLERSAGAASVLLMTALVSCSSAIPAPLEYGRADCAACRMRIIDKRFGAETISKAGKVQQFDAVECMVQYVAATPVKPQSVWVADFDHPGTLIPAGTAHYVARTAVIGGMGSALIALGSGDTASIHKRFDSAPITWDSLATLAARDLLRAPLVSVKGTE